MSSFNFTNFAETLTRYTRENVAMVKIFMREPFAEVLIRSVETSEIDFISSVGGLLGLCMGFSFVSLAEIFYYIFLSFVKNIISKKEAGQVGNVGWNGIVNVE